MEELTKEIAKPRIFCKVCSKPLYDGDLVCVNGWREVTCSKECNEKIWETDDVEPM